ncbi:MAG: thymidine phosphorylase [Erysipelotrichaceae bacterium]|jgi:pyrimidine-nucleoside phosphorylase|nr:thymidine phosphorylase [Erysipelotrichaceae bacterium]
MLMTDIIIKKRDHGVLSKEEIDFFVTGFVSGSIPDYQASSLAMAIVLNGMNQEETVNLTNAFINSGDVVDLSMIKGPLVDKHSTGGVGDKTSLVLGPLVSACGAKLAKMSGRGLGHTGGTIDKMESIPGMRVVLTHQEFVDQVNKIGIAIVGQSGKLVPADKKMYALRDVTGTVESLPLIASSIMSKKIASGADSILLDVKYGSGAFMKNLDDGTALARIMVDIGRGLNRNTIAILTDMDEPLGNSIGNILEVKEAVNTLRGQGPKEFLELCLEAGAIMLGQAGIETNHTRAIGLLKSKITDGTAFQKLQEFVAAQGGDITYLEDLNMFPVSRYIKQVLVKEDGYIAKIDALGLGETAMRLGAGRQKIGDTIDYKSGIILNFHKGDAVKKGDVLLELHSDKLDEVTAAMTYVTSYFKFSKEKVIKDPIIAKVIS